MTRAHGIRPGLAVIATGALLLVGGGASGAHDQAHGIADETGVRGGRLLVAERAEPKTLNPLAAIDAPSKELVGVLTADLIHINRETQQTEPALADWWRISPDGRRYTIHLRSGLRFSDGHRLDADDVVFTFTAYLDERVGAPQRDLLLIDGRPPTVTARGPDMITFDLPQPYAAAERLFDGMAILPRHILRRPYEEGRLGHAWTLATPPDQIVGAGPFKMKQYVPGTRLVVERNPFYWKADRAGQALPYLDEIVFSVVPTEDAQVLRFQAGESDVVSRISAENFAVLDQRRGAGYRMVDVGPGLEYNFLFFNLNDVVRNAAPDVAKHQAWFRDETFRRAVSAAIDRDAIVRLVYRERGAAAASHVTSGNKRWLNTAISRESRSLPRARELLRAAGFSWTPDGRLVDRQRQAVTFSIVTAASNAARVKMATLIQSDLAELGIEVRIVPLEFRAMLARVLDSKDYDAAIFGVASPDADPNPEMNVWLSSGATHLWHPAQTQPATAWEAEIDRLMRQQMVTTDYAARKRLYDRVQALVAEHLPILCLASPHVLVGASARLGNFRPAILEPTTLWNVDRLFWRPMPPARSAR